MGALAKHTPRHSQKLNTYEGTCAASQPQVRTYMPLVDYVMQVLLICIER
jgi:hypothetical protein